MEFEQRRKSARHLESANHVDAVDALEVLSVQTVEVANADELGRAGVVDQHVATAPARLHRSGQRAAIGVLGNVGFLHQHLGT